ncbi:hypothetical protein HY480_04795 [Candidatus Uhrbacteria bacterium]|nr:hypothetical protein [Candidatus Uhrbacteria bacterium]
MIIAILAWWATSKATSAAMRYRLAVQNHDPQEAVKQADRLGSALGMLAFIGVLGGFAIAKARRERFDRALQHAALPAPT